MCYKIFVSLPTIYFYLISLPKIEENAMNEIIGYFFALIIGLVLGLIGGGGSILTVPVLVYLLGVNPVAATAYSLFIVGTTSVFGTFLNLKKKLVDIKIGLLFAVPSLFAIYLTRKFLVPALPEIFFEIGHFTVTKSFFLMTLFAIVMLLASFSMISDRKVKSPKKAPNGIFLFLQIFLVGIIIGLVGAGGGFLFIPVLVLIAKLPIKKAVGTSIFIISINSLIGFLGDVGNFSPDWSFLLRFTFISILGIFVGTYTNKYINEKNLKKGFGWFVLSISVLILAKEFFF